jgi:hypothetical protein
METHADTPTLRLVQADFACDMSLRVAPMRTAKHAVCPDCLRDVPTYAMHRQGARWYGYLVVHTATR